MSQPDAPIRWRPLEPLADPARLARPQVRAITAFWTRVRGWFAEADPTFLERITSRERAAVGLAAEIADVLARPLSVPMLQALHVQATRDQMAARALTASGAYKYVPFPYGKLKDRPNHLVTHGRVVREFCPPELSEPELLRLLGMHEALPDLPEVRAAWLVNGLLTTHPFADGNGRTARLLASWPFLRAGLPPVWGADSERGSGWREALDDAATSGDLGDLTRLFAGHQERLVSRLLLDAEAPPPDLDLDGVLAHRDRLAAARAAWAPHAAAGAEDVPALAGVLREHLEALAGRLGPGVRVRMTDGPAGARRARAAATRAGLAADPSGPGVLVTLSVPAASATLRLGITGLGASGSGALAAFGTVRPRNVPGKAISPLTLFPEEPAAQRRERLGDWVTLALPELAGVLVRVTEVVSS